MDEECWEKSTICNFAVAGEWGTSTALVRHGRQVEGVDRGAEGDGGCGAEVVGVDGPRDYEF